MDKRAILAIIVVFIIWSILDFILHGILLQASYEATASLWRPMEEMKMGLQYLVTLVFAGCFVAIYGCLVEAKSLAAGVKYGALFGVATGISMGFGSYCYMPIPSSLAWSWFLGTLVEILIAGAIVGAIMRSKASS
ncbi:hypothetical protein OAO01_07425 [Oligoflexia bacterium]|nr:hypothetical protein [Oligoflexia bacterium]